MSLYDIENYIPINKIVENITSIVAEMQDLSISHERFIQLSHMLNKEISSVNAPHDMYDHFDVISNAVNIQMSRAAFDPVYNLNSGTGISGRDIDDLLLIDDFGDRPIWNKPEKKCECGAKFTSRPNYHSDYCPLYAEEKK